MAAGLTTSGKPFTPCGRSAVELPDLLRWLVCRLRSGESDVNGLRQTEGSSCSLPGVVRRVLAA